MTAAKRLKRRKKFRKTLSLGERVKVIKQYEKIPSTRALAAMFKCSLTQIKNILRRKEEHIEEWKNDGNLARIKRRQSARFLTVGVIIVEWIYRSRRSGMKLKDDVIVSTARKVAEKLNMVEIRPGNNWLERIRQKFRIGKEDLDEICPIGDYRGESLDFDDIIRDLRASCPGHQFTSSLAFPYELTRRYLKQLKDEATDIAKVRMKNCLEEAKGDKYLQIDESMALNLEEDLVEVVTELEEIEEVEDEEEEVEESPGEMLVKEEPIDHGEYGPQVLQKNPTARDDIEKIQSTMPKLPTVCIKEAALTKGIRNYKEAFNILGPLEHFALGQEDIKALGIINELETHFRDKLGPEVRRRYF